MPKTHRNNIRVQIPEVARDANTGRTERGNSQLQKYHDKGRLRKYIQEKDS